MNEWSRLRQIVSRGINGCFAVVAMQTSHHDSWWVKVLSGMQLWGYRSLCPYEWMKSVRTSVIRCYWCACSGNYDTDVCIRIDEWGLLRQLLQCGGENEWFKCQKNDSDILMIDLDGMHNIWIQWHEFLGGKWKRIRFDRRLFKLCWANYLENLNVVHRVMFGNQRR